MAGRNKTQCSDRLDLPKNKVFTMNQNIRIFWQFHAVTAFRSRLPSEKICGTRENKNGNLLPCKV
ncbi:MAG: hypothetical protein LBC02_11475 [Planctomycetaceae bacterium]|nr:hypothetical protein [Planctomycetaceae bacterium]